MKTIAPFKEYGTGSVRLPRNRLRTMARTWGEWELREITPEQKAAYSATEFLAQAWVNNRYAVQVYNIRFKNEAFRVPVQQVSIGRHGDLEPITWDELQRIKEELFQGRWAIEFYPPSEYLVDQALMRHVWVFEKGYDPPIGLHLPNAWGKDPNRIITTEGSK